MYTLLFHDTHPCSKLKTMMSDLSHQPFHGSQVWCGSFTNGVSYINTPTSKTSSYPGWIKSPHVVTCHTYFPIGKICHNFIFFFWGGGSILHMKSQSAKICLNFNFRGGGGYSATEKSQSAKICLNFNFRGGGILQLKNHKVPRSA